MTDQTTRPTRSMTWEYLCTQYYPSVRQEAKGPGTDKEGTDTKAVTGRLDGMGDEGRELVDVIFLEESSAFFREMLYYFRRPKSAH